MGVMDRDRWRVLEPLLDRALEMPVDERAAWLDVLREESPALAAELTALLSSEEAADQRGFLAAPLGASPAGLELGAYTLERPLGEGGMGSVWLARRTDGRFEGYAAVKLLNLALLGPAGQARFRREGSVLARLTHPGIARLMDAGVCASGQPYLVLEYVDGERIDRYADAHHLSLDARIGLVLDVLAAVGHAHAHLIVHRDLKPSNILVTHDGVVKLLDFGIAKLLGEDVGGGRSALTVESAHMMTPEFAAPEQVAGGAITTATDVYACGVLLYLLATGRHPTAHGSQTPAEAIRALSEVRPARTRLGDLDTILAKTLHKDPRQRYQTVDAFADDLQRYRRHDPVRARRDSIAYRTRKFVRRHRAGVAGVAGMVLALLAATGFSVAQMRNARRQRDAALYASRRADAQIEFQSQLMSQIGDRPITMREILDRARAVLEREYAGDPRLLAATLVQLSSRYADLGDSKIRGGLLARAESLAIANHDDGQRIEVQCDMVDNLRTQGRYDEAHRLMDRAESMLRAHPDPRVEVTCLQSMTDLENEVGPGHRGPAAIRRAITIRDSLGETKDAAYISLFSTLATALDRAGQHRDALGVYRRAMAILDTSGQGETMNRAIIEHDLAVSMIDLGETAEAERLLHDVLDRIARSDPSGHLPTQPLIHYAHVALFNRHTDSAAKYFTMLARQAVHEHNSYWEGRAFFGLARAQLRLGRRAALQRTMARFRAISDSAPLQKTDDELTDARILDGRLALSRGDAVAAHHLVVQVLQSNGYFDGKRRLVFRSALILAAESALAMHDAGEALGYARAARTIATLDSLTETRSAYIGEARLVEARALLALGDSSSARTNAERAVNALRSGAGPAHPRTREAEQLVALLR